MSLGEGILSPGQGAAIIAAALVSLGVCAAGAARLQPGSQRAGG